ncbi:MAG TPA: prepilin-type N-terminal cleavage/methylation domain-containing protein [Verrucomicrobiae bacterium]
MSFRASITKPPQGGYSLVEVLIAALVLGIMVLALLGGFSSGLAVVHATRDNLRATQILTQKMETIRLFKWSQLGSSDLSPGKFDAVYDPSGGSVGTRYAGQFSTNSAPSSIPIAYRDKMRLVSVDLYWTNRTSATKAVVQNRQVQTFSARYGMQPYVYK